MANMGIKEEFQEVEKELEQEQKKPPEERRGILDIVSTKLVSRKLLVWITSTTLLCFAKITPEEWTAVTLGYVGAEGFADLAVKWRSAGTK
jgi:hypothetical protein